MLRASEVIQLAKDHPLYLCGKAQHWNWLCAVIAQLWTERKITREEDQLARDAITASFRDSDNLYGTIYLRGYLTMTRVIQAGTPYGSDTYRRAAHAYWADLIAKLQAQGL